MFHNRPNTETLRCIMKTPTKLFDVRNELKTDYDFNIFLFCLTTVFYKIYVTQYLFGRLVIH